MEQLLEQVSKVETVVRQFDGQGTLVCETTTVVVERVPEREPLPVGMYL